MKATLATLAFAAGLLLLSTPASADIVTRAEVRMNGENTEWFCSAANTGFNDWLTYDAMVASCTMYEGDDLDPWLVHVDRQEVYIGTWSTDPVRWERPYDGCGTYGISANFYIYRDSGVVQFLQGSPQRHFCQMFALNAPFCVAVSGDCIGGQREVWIEWGASSNADDSQVTTVQYNVGTHHFAFTSSEWGDTLTSSTCTATDSTAWGSVRTSTAWTTSPPCYFSAYLPVCDVDHW
jgi:hypothetical protein